MISLGSFWRRLRKVLDKLIEIVSRITSGGFFFLSRLVLLFIIYYGWTVNWKSRVEASQDSGESGRIATGVLTAMFYK